ncbi:MAG: hypothetical protein K0U68_05575 [Gammaproteobacteria bacterium]|nr:hypothetical protein [Gammaproteobacteria bacterium]
MHSLKDIAKTLPGFPSDPVFPDIAAQCSNLQPDLARFNEWPAEPTDGRRFYVDPAIILLATADDSGVDESIRQAAIQGLRKQHSIHLHNDLPCFYGDDPTDPAQTHCIRDRKIDRWGDGSESAKHIFDPSYVEHSLVDYTIALASLDPSKENIEWINEFAKWLIHDTLHGQGGYRLNYGQFYFRAFIRWLWLLIAFSEAEVVEQQYRQLLKQQAIKILTWAVDQNADGSMESIGYDQARHAWYMHLAESINFQTRSVWIYFHQIANEIASRMLYTGFYLENTELVNRLIEMIRITNETIFKATDMDVTTIRAESFFIDKHTYTPLPSQEYPPAQFWLSVDTKEQFNQLITGVNNEWQPFFKFQLAPVCTWTRLS